MTEILLDALSWFFLISGGLLGLAGGIGLFRFPDFYTRIHAAGVTETLSTGLIILGLMLQSGWGLVLIKLLLILLVLAYTGPTASHALAKAAFFGRLKPAAKDERGDKQ